MAIDILQTVSLIMLSISSGLFFLILALPKIIDTGSIDRFKNFRDNILVKYVEILKSLDSKSDKLRYIKEDVYPLTAYVSSLWNFIEAWDSYQSFLTKLFLVSSVLWFLTIFAPLEFSVISINPISLLIWVGAIEVLIFSVLILYRFIKSRNKFTNTINKIELNEITIDDFINERKSVYKKLLKKRKLLS